MIWLRFMTFMRVVDNNNMCCIINMNEIIKYSRLYVFRKNRVFSECFNIERKE